MLLPQNQIEGADLPAPSILASVDQLDFVKTSTRRNEVTSSDAPETVF